MRFARLTAALACLALIAPAAAAAAPDCTRNPPEVNPLLHGQGTLESTIVDHRGRLYFTSGQTGGTGELRRMRRPGADPTPVVSGVEAPGGLVLLPGRDLLLGYGDSVLGGATGTIDPQAGLLRVTPKGESEPYADGLAMANGVARAPDGTVFASTDVGIGIDRVAPDGTVENAWASIISSNGLVVSRSGRFLYAAQTFQPAAIQQIDIAHPNQIEPFFQAQPGDIAAGFDGMTRDNRGNLYVAANGAGEVWRIGRDGTACVLARGLGMPSAVALGRNRGRFGRPNLYVVNFGGDVIELKGARRSRP